MTNQEVFDRLSELEEFFYCKLQNPEEMMPFWSILAQMHQDAKTMLVQWHNLTGCRND